jgi:ketosteroid isomerase-like protein
MRRTRAYSWLGSLLLLAVMGAAHADPAESQRAVLAAENIWLHAQQSNQYDAIAPYLAETFVQGNTDGSRSVGKAQALADAKKVTYSSVAYTDLNATAYGDAVIVTGTFTGKGTDSDGKSFAEHASFIDSWVKIGGKWLCMASADTSIK